MKEIDESLRRLQTGYIDIYQVHWPDPLLPIEETAAAMHELYKQGKIRAIGVSNYSLEQMNVFRRLAPLHTAQPPYKSDPKFQPPRYAQYLKAVERLDQQNYGKRVLELAVRWTLDQLFVTVALWGACHPDQLAPIADVGGWKLDSAALKAINEKCSEVDYRAGRLGVLSAASPVGAKPGKGHAM